MNLGNGEAWVKARKSRVDPEESGPSQGRKDTNEAIEHSRDMITALGKPSCRGERVRCLV